jgi:hypothetical protein
MALKTYPFKAYKLHHLIRGARYVVAGNNQNVGLSPLLFSDNKSFPAFKRKSDAVHYAKTESRWVNEPQGNLLIDFGGKRLKIGRI